MPRRITSPIRTSEPSANIGSAGDTEPSWAVRAQPVCAQCPGLLVSSLKVTGLGNDLECHHSLWVHIQNTDEAQHPYVRSQMHGTLRTPGSTIQEPPYRCCVVFTDPHYQGEKRRCGGSHDLARSYNGQ